MQVCLHWTAKKSLLMLHLRFTLSGRHNVSTARVGRWRLNFTCFLLQGPVLYIFHPNKNIFYYGQNKTLFPVQTLSVHLLRLSINKDKKVEASFWLYMDTSLLKPLLRVSSCICPGHFYWPRFISPQQFLLCSWNILRHNSKSAESAGLDPAETF